MDILTAQTLAELIQRTHDKEGLKVSVGGTAYRVAHSRGSVSRMDRFCVSEISRLYREGRAAWLRGDLGTVADLFGVLVD